MEVKVLMGVLSTLETLPPIPLAPVFAHFVIVCDTCARFLCPWWLEFPDPSFHGSHVGWFSHVSLRVSIYPNTTNTLRRSVSHFCPGDVSETGQEQYKRETDSGSDSFGFFGLVQPQTHLYLEQTCATNWRAAEVSISSIGHPVSSGSLPGLLYSCLNQQRILNGYKHSRRAVLYYSAKFPTEQSNTRSTSLLARQLDRANPDEPVPFIAKQQCLLSQLSSGHPPDTGPQVSDVCSGCPASYRKASSFSTTHASKKRSWQHR